MNYTKCYWAVGLIVHTTTVSQAKGLDQ